MAKLVWNAPDGTIGEHPLQQGVNTLGRLDDNTVCITDGSVSSRHAEIVVEGDQLVVRDYGSTNGTFISEQRVEESPLRMDEPLRLGSVQARVISDAEPAAKPAIAVPRVSLRVQRHEPEAGVEAPPSIPVPSPVVSSARGRAIPPRAPEPPSGSFYSLVGGAFKYPAQRGGMFLIISGAIFFALLDVARKFFPFGVIWLMATAISGGYLFSFMQNVISITINGDQDDLGWPDLTSVVDDVFMPFVRLVLIWVVYLAPGIFVIGYLQNPILGIAVLALGVLCVPMALLTVALADSIAGLNPIVVFSGIAKAPGQYFVTLIIFAVVLGVSGAIDWLVSSTGIILLPTLVSAFVGLYGLTVEMRVIGLLYRCNSREFNWF